MAIGLGSCYFLQRYVFFCADDKYEKIICNFAKKAAETFSDNQKRYNAFLVILKK